MFQRIHGFSLFVTTALCIGACDTGEPLEPNEYALEVASPDFGTVDETTGVVSGGSVSVGSDSGVDDGADDWGDTGWGDTGDDEVSEDFGDLGGPTPVCEEADVALLQLGADGQVEDMSAALEISAAPVSCPWSASATSKYVDYQCSPRPAGGAYIDCDYWCDCSASFSSPCNPPVATCGDDFKTHRSIRAWVGISPLGMWQCAIQGPVACRLENQKYGLGTCAAWCKNQIPKRTVDCPDCPK